MQGRIHRGTREIGGSCIELAADGARLLLDLGLPLGADPADTSVHPTVPSLAGGAISYSRTGIATTPGSPAASAATYPW